jgi:hypothetical protein
MMTPIRSMRGQRASRSKAPELHSGRIFRVSDTAYDAAGYHGPGPFALSPSSGAHLADHSLCAHPLAQDAARYVRGP